MAQIPPLFPNLRPDIWLTLFIGVFNYFFLISTINAFINHATVLFPNGAHYVPEGITGKGAQRLGMFSCTSRHKLCQSYFLALLMSSLKLKRCGLLNNLTSKGAEMSFWSVCLFPLQDSTHRILLHFTHEASSSIFESYLEFKSLFLISRICLRRWHMQGFCLLDISIRRFATNLFFTLWRVLSKNGIVVIY